MGDDITQCPDGHFCLNGSLCQEIEGDEGNYFCDCDVAFDKKGNAFQGLKCQHKATVYCTYDEAVSKKSFCTNGGTCLAEIASKEAHVGCRCGDNYEGEHCQFVKGTRPDGWPYNQQSEAGSPSSGGGGGGSNGGVIFGIILAVLVLFAIIVFVALRIVKKKNENKALAGSGAVPELDPDGGKLQEAMGGVTTEEAAQNGDEFGDTMKNEEEAAEDEGEEGEII
mmetsp:Transcript_8191/g.11252  ORF Transcript_8191/g.11252 Transcript_8191/m.11252 type:complete len:224 (-) Transcript_8191:206-877(-)|eukprot:CAMPEP_0185724038 /NCGR_PEP_ID=MMETSP1171-20130828/649_1 /TAXON_ID=374046 /ORGANISM="Helicotheca tamensis, Strain CCMP826" /LENGTH=223 /DNA_ID=CAMNT_0028391813 /DNA_START=155 /DNA_END=826 /DNA_ORIENTATION=-